MPCEHPSLAGLAQNKLGSRVHDEGQFLLFFFPLSSPYYSVHTEYSYVGGDPATSAVPVLESLDRD